MAAGNIVNPYAVSWEMPRTVHEFLTRYYKVELRWAMRAGQDWVWLRVTNRYASNRMFVGWNTRLVTQYRTVTGLPYGSGNNQAPGSQRCTAAISMGPSTSRYWKNVGCKASEPGSKGWEWDERDYQIHS